MKIFEAEKNLGLQIAIQANASVCYYSKATASNLFGKAELDNIATYDDTLWPMSDILVSTGCNLNDDVFNNIKTWKARNSSNLKPLDLNHDQNIIIGSIVGSRIINDNLEVLDAGDDASIPDSYHILNDSVIYRTWSDEDKLKEIDQLIEEIKNGEWFVSMECQFDGFDYFVTAPDGTTATIERNEETAFLTKYLRAYDGVGYYTDASTGEKYLIARELNNIVFIGKGVVKQPGNPNSIIFAGLQQQTVYEQEVEVVNSNNKEMITMADETKDKVALLESTIATLKKELEEKQGQAFADLKVKFDESEKTIAGLKTENKALTESIEKLSKAKADMDDEMAKKDKEMADKDTEMCKMKDEKTKSERKAKLLKAGADEDEAESKSNEFSNLSDAQFDGLVATLSKAWDKKDESKSEDDKSDAAANLINNATVVKDPVLNIPATTTSDTVSAGLAAHIGSYLKTGKNKNK